MQRPTNNQIIREIARAMRFSEIFFEAFAITRDRAAQWQFVSILLRLEQKAEIEVLTLRSDKQFKALIEQLGYETRDHALKVLIDGLQDEEGALIDPPQSRRKDRKIRLNARFEMAATRFMQGFWSKLEFPESTLDQLPPIEGMKFIYGAIMNEYYPVWHELVTKLGKIWQPNDTYEAEQVRDELLNKAPYWTVLVTSWRRALGDRDISTDESGLWRATFDSMRGADPDELKTCIAYLSKKDGPQILLRSRRNRLDVFTINPAYKDAFTWYGAEICRLNRALGEKLASGPPLPETAQ